MPSDSKESPVDLTANAAQASEVVSPSSAPSAPSIPILGMGTSITIGGPRPQPLIIPPERLPPLTSDQVTQVLSVAAVKNEHDHQRAMRELDIKAEDEKSSRSFIALAIMLLGIVVGVALWKDHFDWVKELIVPIATGVGGYLAGRGQERLNTTPTG